MSLNLGPNVTLDDGVDESPGVVGLLRGLGDEGL